MSRQGSKPLKAGISKSFRLQKPPSAPARPWALTERGNKEVGTGARQKTVELMLLSRRLSATIPKNTLQSKHGNECFILGRKIDSEVNCHGHGRQKP